MTGLGTRIILMLIVVAIIIVVHHLQIKNIVDNKELKRTINHIIEKNQNPLLFKRQNLQLSTVKINLEMRIPARSQKKITLYLNMS